MAASTVQVLVATAEREVYRGEAEMVIAPGAAGELGIMPKHSPLISALKPGELRLKRGEEFDEVFVSGGFIEVQPEMITVLADTAERASDFSEAEATEAARKAEELVAQRQGDTDLALAEAELAYAAARLAWIRKKKKSH